MPESPKTFSDFRASCPSMSPLEAAAARVGWDAAIAAAVRACVRVCIADESLIFSRDSEKAAYREGSSRCAARIAGLATEAQHA